MDRTPDSRSDRKRSQSEIGKWPKQKSVRIGNCELTIACHLIADLEPLFLHGHEECNVVFNHPTMERIDVTDAHFEMHVPSKRSFLGAGKKT